MIWIFLAPALLVAVAVIALMAISKKAINKSQESFANEYEVAIIKKKDSDTQDKEE